MNLRLPLLLLLAFCQFGYQFPEQPSEKVWVFFTDKANQNFDPISYFHPDAITRRNLEGIDLYDITDVPVNPKYVESVSKITGNERVVSRWFNAMCCLATEAQIKELRKLNFVKDVHTTTRPLNCQVEAAFLQQQEMQGDFDVTTDQINFLRAQTGRMGAEYFKQNKMDGTGIRIAIFDVGFKSYLTNPAFEHIRKDNRIAATYDFVKKKTYTDEGGSHGCFVMSCIGGRIHGEDMGMATGATFLLARTETWTEFYSEEENWLAAAEWADKNGAHIINSSLGYTFNRYFTEDMDGETSLVAKAANMAAKKGILVINSAGNEGSAKWKIIGTPADADSVLSIGGIEPETGIHTSFSSFGPTRDKRLKPNVTAYGHVIGSGPKGISKTQGTSFSSPLTAGFAACAKQSRPGFKNMKMFDEIQKSGDLYPYFDYAHGYGVPQARYFFRLPNYKSPTFTIESKGDRVKIVVNKIEGDFIVPSDTTGILLSKRYLKLPEYVFYHIENSNGYLDKYFVVDPGVKTTGDANDNKVLTTIPEGEGPLVIRKEEYARPFTLRVYYKGYTTELLVK